MVRLIACSTLLQITFYPVADYVLPCCRLRSTLLQGMFYPVAKPIPYQRKNEAGTRGVRTVGTVATELLFLPATLLRLGRNVAGKDCWVSHHS